MINKFVVRVFAGPTTLISVEDISVNYLPYVYRVTHKETGKFYIGFRYKNKVPANLDLGHIYKTSSKTIKKIGIEHFRPEIMCECETKEEAFDIEQLLIYANRHDPLLLNGYCFDPYAQKPRFISDRTGSKNTNEAKQKVSIAFKGKTYEELYGKEKAKKVKKQRSVAMTKRMLGTTGENHPKFGKKQSPEKNRIRSERFKGPGNPMFGKTFTEEHRRKISESMKRYRQHTDGT